MPSILDLLRLHNVFGSQMPVGNDLPSQGGISGMIPRTGLDPTIPNPTPTIDPTHNQDATDISQIFKEIYTPDNTASDKTKELLNEMPERTKPNLIHKILGSVVGMGYGPEAGYKAANAPYFHRLEDWQTQFNPWEKEATNERQQNAQERIAASDIASKVLTERKNKSTEEINKEKLKVSQQRADAYVWDKTHPDHIIKEDASGHLIAVNKKDGTAEVVTDSDGDPIKSSSLTDEQRLNIQHGNRLSEIAAQGNESRSTESLRNKDVLGQIQERGNQARRTRETPAPPKPQSDKSKTESASQQRVRQVNNAQNYINQHPEAKNWIKIENGLVTVAPIKTGIFRVGGNGLTQDKRDEILKAINGETPYHDSSMTNQPAIRKEIPGQPGKFAVSRDGGKTWKAE